MERYREGDRVSSTELGYRVLRQLVAARYGQSPADVDNWPADDYADAVATLSISGDL